VRIERLQEEIRREVSAILRRSKDPRIGFVSVTGVEVSADLRHAKVFVSVYGSDEERDATMKGLERATGFVRTELAKAIRLRFVPEIVFRYDPSIVRGARVNALLQSLKSEGTAAGGEETKDA
jgi:ribosome-binding factor A